MKTIVSLIGICLLLSACHKSDKCTPGVDAFNCQAFKTGVAFNDDAAAAAEIDKLTADLLPATTNPADEYGQQQNINILVQRLSAKCDVTATLLCYSCIETYPAQSEIRVIFTLNGTTYNRVLDISVTPAHMLIYLRNHE